MLLRVLTPLYNHPEPILFHSVLVQAPNKSLLHSITHAKNSQNTSKKLNCQLCSPLLPSPAAATAAPHSLAVKWPLPPPPPRPPRPSWGGHTSPASTRRPAASWLRWTASRCLLRRPRRRASHGVGARLWSETSPDRVLLATWTSFRLFS
jgi:hypothetical protein